jgi:hypothetical protein
MTFVQSQTMFSDASSTTIPVSLTGVGAGNLIVVWAKWEGGATTATASDGTSSLTMGTVGTHSNSDLSGVFGYLLSANSGARTYTITLGATRSFTRMAVLEFSHTGTVTFDAQNTGSGTSTTPTSGNITTTGGTGALALGGYGEYSGGTLSNSQINGVAADSLISTPALSAVWYRILSAPFTAGHANVTLSGSGDWVCHILALKTS